MPSMMEIYQNNAFGYDELVNHEDYKNNPGQLLESACDFNDKNVIEPGGGTGRVTRLLRLFCAMGPGTCLKRQKSI